jgi:hypothetical protein
VIGTLTVATIGPASKYGAITLTCPISFVAQIINKITINIFFIFSPIDYMI